MGAVNVALSKKSLAELADKASLKPFVGVEAVLFLLISSLMWAVNVTQSKKSLAGRSDAL